MPEGPFGGPRPFAVDRKTVLVLVGIDGPEPPRDVLQSAEQLVEDRINRSLGLKLGTLTVAVTSNENPTREQRRVFGGRIQHAQQYDVQTPWKEITKEQIANVEHEVRQQLEDVQFNIVGTETTVV